MNLDDAQRAKVREWIDQGLKLAEIQSRLASEMNVRMTYMDVRLLIDDLKLQVKDPEPPQPPPTLGAARGTAQPGLPNQPAAPLSQDPAPAGGVSVSVDQVTRPGAMISGKVKFSDGKSAEWYLDQYGRLGLASAEKGYRPSEADVMDFQAALQNELAKLGY